LLSYPGCEEFFRKGQGYEWHVLRWARDGAAIAFRSQKEQSLLIAIRGTLVSSLWNIATDLQYFKAKVPELEGQRVHSGFVTAARGLLDALNDKGLLPAKEDVANWRIGLTGHSLGGAVACVAGMFLQMRGFQVQHIVTFGQPLVTNYKGANYWHAKLPLLRVVNHGDPVPLAPPTFPSPLNLWGGRFYHFGTQLSLAEDGSVTVTDPIPSGSPTFHSLWGAIIQRRVTIKDHSTAPLNSYPRAIIDSEGADAFLDKFQGDYFDEFLFAIFRRNFPHEVTESTILPQSNQNVEWKRFKIRSNFRVFRTLLQDYSADHLRLVIGNMSLSIVDT
jgi:hypothetical protein